MNNKLQYGEIPNLTGDYMPPYRKYLFDFEKGSRVYEEVTGFDDKTIFSI